MSVSPIRKLQQLMLATALLAGAGCGSSTVDGPVSGDIPATAIDESFGGVGVREIAHSYFSGFNAPSRMVIRNEEVWRAAWATLNIGMQPGVTPPTIDFSRSAVILVALGERGSSGYDIRISRVAHDANRLYVEVTSTSPGDQCATLTVLTQPVDVVVIPHNVGEVAFVERHAIAAC